MLLNWDKQSLLLIRQFIQLDTSWSKHWWSFYLTVFASRQLVWIQSQWKKSQLDKLTHHVKWVSLSNRRICQKIMIVKQICLPIKKFCQINKFAKMSICWSGCFAQWSSLRNSRFANEANNSVMALAYN